MTSKLLKTFFIFTLIALFLFLIISRTPAAWAAWAVHKAAPNVWLNDVTGTLWRGKASTSQVDLGKESIALGEVNWKLNPWSLLILSPCISFDAQVPGQSISGNYCRGIGGSNTLKDVSIDGPMALFKKVAPIEGKGAVSLQVVSAKFDEKSIDKMDARFSWQNASVYVENRWFNLGSLASEITHDGQGGVNAKIFDLSGPYTLAMDATWAIGGDWKTKGKVTPKPGVPEVVIQALQVFGEDVGGGAYAIQWP